MRKCIVITTLLAILAAPAALARSWAGAPTGVGESTAYGYQINDPIPATWTAPHPTDRNALGPAQTSAAGSTEVTLVARRGGGSFRGHGGYYGHPNWGHSYRHPYYGYRGYPNYHGRSYFHGGFGPRYYPYGRYYSYPYKYYSHPYGYYPYRYYPYGHYPYQYYGTPGGYFYFWWK